ncbi:dihydrofolate reductase family protein [Mucilaginibacter celer]|uniref:Deaminase n=1 Tax=Mucilaginibacter celer TaxID=2305508 RepID=A0A494VMR7_9SPHI|nr:dihydrofolate reductase family protein [Mucilaginibacter celer]AYL95409.1 deaminase [Mucilaginibacter celer]
MRKVMFAMNISIDGCYDHTLFMPDAELMAYFTNLMLDTGVIVYGRKTYQLMVPYWPDVAKSQTGPPEDIAFAKAMTPIPKIVLSRTLKVADENTGIVNDGPEDLIRQLKQQPGKKIALSSTSLLAEMLALELIDELYLIVHPILAGSGERLFENYISPQKHNFKLTASQPFNSGAIALHYHKND